MNAFSGMKTLFNSYDVQHDAHEFLTFFFDALHEVNIYFV